jgi:hypothetical protein
MKTIYSVRYTGSTPDAIKQYVQHLDALLVDIRFYDIEA